MYEQGIDCLNSSVLLSLVQTSIVSFFFKYKNSNKSLYGSKWLAKVSLPKL